MLPALKSSLYTFNYFCESPYNIYFNSYFKNGLSNWYVFPHNYFKLLTKWLSKCVFCIYIFSSTFWFYRWLIFHSSLSSSPEAKGVVANLFQCHSLAFIFICCAKKPTVTLKIPQKTKLQTTNPKTLTWYDLESTVHDYLASVSYILLLWGRSTIKFRMSSC